MRSDGMKLSLPAQHVTTYQEWTHY